MKTNTNGKRTGKRAWLGGLMGNVCAIWASFLATVQCVAGAGVAFDPKTFEIHPALEIQLYAAEPDVVDPVALAFDERGQMYVVEMRDYPLGMDGAGRPGGTIRVLRDTDGDGKVDRSVLFAEGLSFPTSIACWRGGVLVTAPPEIVFLKDTDGDGKADQRQVILAGFKLGVTDSNLNGLRWGLDNRMHVANGGNNGAVTNPRKATIGARELRDVDLSFDPDTGEWQPTFHTGGGFGLVFDDWGNRFTTYNIDHVQGQMLAVKYLEKASLLFPVRGTVSISDHGDMARIFPISTAVTRPNHPEQAGHFSAAGGLGYLGIQGWPGDLSGSLVVGDVVGNLSHRDVLVGKGPVLEARRGEGEKEREFFASRDPACRPVAFELGPDGGLYVADMQREVIEHPDYIPAKAKAKMDMRAGADRGRIYRLTPKGIHLKGPIAWPERTSQWVLMLGHSNQWWRTTAHRVLYEMKSEEAVGEIRGLWSGRGGDLAKLHALWLLQGWGKLSAMELKQALGDSERGIQVAALQILENHKEGREPLKTTVIGLLAAADPRVRYQAALTGAYLYGGDTDLAAAAGGLWKMDLEYRWSRIAALTAVGEGAHRMLVRLLQENPDWLQSLSHREALAELSEVVGRGSRTVREDDTLQLVRGLLESRLPVGLRLACIEGLTRGWEAAGLPAVRGVNASGILSVALKEERVGIPWMRGVMQLAQGLGLRGLDGTRAAVEKAGALIQDRSGTLESRIEAVELLGLVEPAQAEPLLVGMLQGAEPAAIQEPAAQVLCRRTDPSIALRLLESWRTAGPSARGVILSHFLSRKPWHGPFMDAVESGQLTLGELNLDLEQRRQLLRRANAEIRQRASKFWTDEEYSNRQAKVEEWLAKLPRQGSSARGRAVFERLCAGCHRSGTLGHSVGPELSSMGHRSVEDLVSNILDPNMALNPAFGTVAIETRGGELVSGVLGLETATQVTVRQAMGLERVVARSEVERMEFTGRSLMPEGLEAGMTAQELRDVVAFIQGRDGLKQ